MSEYFNCAECETPHSSREEADACCACEECAEKDKRIEELEDENERLNHILNSQIPFLI